MNMDTPAVSTSEKKIRPSIYITSEDLPEVSDWKVGGEYTVKIKQVSRTVDEKDGKESVSGSFELIAADSKDSTDEADKPVDEGSNEGKVEKTTAKDDYKY